MAELTTLFWLKSLFKQFPLQSWFLVQSYLKPNLKCQNNISCLVTCLHLFTLWKNILRPIWEQKENWLLITFALQNILLTFQKVFCLAGFRTFPQPTILKLALLIWRLNPAVILAFMQGSDRLVNSNILSFFPHKIYVVLYLLIKLCLCLVSHAKLFSSTWWS